MFRRPAFAGYFQVIGKSPGAAAESLTYPSNPSFNAASSQAVDFAFLPELASAAALRACEIEADVLLKGTRVDGVYTADPEKDPTAVKFQDITFDEVYSRGLKIMDLTAFTLCKENKCPIMVFDMDTPGNLQKLIAGEQIGTLVHN